MEDSNEKPTLTPVERQKIAYKLLGNIDRWEEIDPVTGDITNGGEQ